MNIVKCYSATFHVSGLLYHVDDCEMIPKVAISVDRDSPAIVDRDYRKLLTFVTFLWNIANR